MSASAHFPTIAPTPETLPSPRVAGGGVLRVSVPEAVGGKTVIGQLTVDRAAGRRIRDGLRLRRRDADRPLMAPSVDPTSTSTAASQSVASNRLIVKADDSGDVCFYTLRPAALIVDINGVSAVPASTRLPTERTDTRSANTAARLDHLEQRAGVAAVRTHSHRSTGLLRSLA